jgi:two-component system nitrogen regulation sensor histidine kinase GlnL
MIDLAEAVKSTTVDWTRSSEGVSVKNEFDPAFEQVRIDASAVDVCLGVLLGNSLDAVAANSGDKWIQVRLRTADRDEVVRAGGNAPVLAIDVADNGPGVPTEIEPRLFNVMKSGKAKGLGFGLRYCRHIATSARGDVYYHAAGAGNTTFTLLFPYSKAAAEEDVHG